MVTENINDTQLERHAAVADGLAALREDILEAISAERDTQVAKAHGGDTEEFDRGNSRNDWVTYICAYAGDAGEKIFKNDRNGEDFEKNLVKVGALVVAALEAHAKGYC